MNLGIYPKRFFNQHFRKKKSILNITFHTPSKVNLHLKKKKRIYVRWILFSRICFCPACVEFNIFKMKSSEGHFSLSAVLYNANLMSSLHLWVLTPLKMKSYLSWESSDHRTCLRHECKTRKNKMLKACGRQCVLIITPERQDSWNNHSWKAGSRFLWHHFQRCYP